MSHQMANHLLRLQDEMNRFEEEIGASALPFLPLPPPPTLIFAPPPPLVSTLFVPLQVQKNVVKKDIHKENDLKNNKVGNFILENEEQFQKQGNTPVISADPHLYSNLSPNVLSTPPPVEFHEEVKIKKYKKLKQNDLNKMKKNNSSSKKMTLTQEHQNCLLAKNLKKDPTEKRMIRKAGGQIWEDKSLLDWEEDDFRIFCGDLGNDVTDDILRWTFSKYPSFNKAKVIRDKRTSKSKGYGFVSFKNAQDYINAMKEINGRYVGSRPIKLRKSTWRSRNIEVVKNKEKEKKLLNSKFPILKL